MLGTLPEIGRYRGCKFHYRYMLPATLSIACQSDPIDIATDLSGVVPVSDCAESSRDARAWLLDHGFSFEPRTAGDKCDVERDRSCLNTDVQVVYIQDGFDDLHECEQAAVLLHERLHAYQFESGVRVSDDDGSWAKEIPAFVQGAQAQSLIYPQDVIEGYLASVIELWRSDFPAAARYWEALSGDIVAPRIEMLYEGILGE